MPHVRAGKLTLLDISYSERRPDFPDVPTLWEVGYGEAYVPSRYSIWAPAGAPQPIVARMHTTMAKTARTPRIEGATARHQRDLSRADARGAGPAAGRG
jgi:tripartite-type tricarboxylate transporter receptor subunit TctC